MPTDKEQDFLQQRVAKLEAICTLGRLISSSLDIDTVVDRTMAAAEDVAEAESSSVWHLDPETGELSFHFMRGGVDDTMRDIRIPVGEGIVGHAVREKKPILVEDVSQDPRWQPRVDEASGFKTRSILCIPLIIEGRTLGAIQLLNKKGGGSFASEDLEWMTFLAGQVAIALENARYHEQQLKLERLQRDLDIARSIHSSLFPTELPRLREYVLAGRTEACYEIGGDYYDAILLPCGNLLMVMADVAGKGISAALIASSFRATLRSVSAVEPSLELLTSGLNHIRHLDGQRSRLRHVTAFLGFLDVERHTLDVVSAGHNPALLATGTEVREIPSTTLPLGIQQEIDCVSTTIDFPVDSTLLLYTDGITEAHRGEEEFGTERLIDFLRENRQLSPEKLLVSLWREVRGFADGKGPADDKTALVLRRVGS